jgi:hypothetical protein
VPSAPFVRDARQDEGNSEADRVERHYERAETGMNATATIIIAAPGSIGKMYQDQMLRLASR